MVTTNYSNRKRDLYMMGDLSFSFGPQTQAVNFSLNSETGGKICTGALKTIQKVIVQLLTYLYYYDPDWGSPLAGLIEYQTMSEVVAYIESAFPLSAEAAIRLLNSQIDINTPLDESVKELELLDTSVDYDSGKVSMRIRVTLMSGDSTELVLPISKNV